MGTAAHGPAMCDRAQVTTCRSAQGSSESQLTTATWEHIQKRQAVVRGVAQGMEADLKALKKSARGDSREWICQDMGLNVGLRQRWKAVRNLKQDYAPNAYTKLGHDGQVLAADARPEAVAKCLATMHGVIRTTRATTNSGRPLMRRTSGSSTTS